MPWLGKRFDAAAGRGDNVLRSSARLPSKLLWPLYSMGDADGDTAAFDFETAVEPGKVDPDCEVLKIDYSPVERNPRFTIKPIRDELVEIVPGANLGKILWRSRRGRLPPDRVLRAEELASTAGTQVIPCVPWLPRAGPRSSATAATSGC